jgi:hypothetical protein
MPYATENQTAIELYIYAKNSRDYMQKRWEPVARNLERKHRKGAYIAAKALKAWRNIADDVAARYCAEFCGKDEKWFSIFSMRDRADLALEFLADWTAEIECGNSWLREHVT